MMTTMMMLLYKDRQHVSIYLVIYHICYPFGIIDWQDLQRVGVRELFFSPVSTRNHNGMECGYIAIA